MLAEVSVECDFFPQRGGCEAAMAVGVLLVYEFDGYDGVGFAGRSGFSNTVGRL